MDQSLCHRGCRRPLVVANALTRLSMWSFVSIYGSLKFSLSCKVMKSMGFGPPILREGDTPVSDMHYQITLTSEYVASFR